MSDATRVLIADDQPLFASGLRLQLDAQHDIVCVGIAVDGEDAIAQATTTRPDVVLMDVRMPGMNGIAATDAITGLGENAPAVIVLTTIRRDEAVYLAMKAGAAGFLTKDATPAEVLDAIRTAHGARNIPSAAPTLELVRALEATGEGRLAKAANDPGSAIEGLTVREREVFLLLAKGLGNSEIAGSAFLSETTVKTHVRSILHKLHLRSRVQVVVFTYENGLVGSAR
jgi:DNA-binding NarL/FixJ family response regulator